MADEREGAFATIEASEAGEADCPATLLAAHEQSGPRPSSRNAGPSTIASPAAPEDVTRTGVVAVTGGRKPRRDAALFEAGDMVDHFEVKRLLGEGGMGAVYLAVDQKLGRRVALKVVQPEFLGSAKAVESFLFEARTTARFNHPHIITIYAVGEFDGRPYVALEYLEGKSLQEIMRRRRLTLEEALATGLAIADALAEAHSHDVLHRDLKPANVLIPPDGRLRVLDFGLAKRVQHDGESPPSSRLMTFGPREYTWAGAGTPAYMAPEQWRADASTVATDVWALGVLLFEVIAGKRPFDEASLEDQERIVTGEAQAPRLSAFAEAPDELADLIERCLAKDPAKRPNATEVASLLRALSGSERAPRITIPMSSRDSDAPGPEAPTVVDVADSARAVETTTPSPQTSPPARRSLLLVAMAALGLGAGAVYLLTPPSTPSLDGMKLPVVTVVTPPAVPVSAATPATSPAPSSASAPSPVPAPLPRARRAFDRRVATHNMERVARSAAFMCKNHDGPRAFTVNATFGPNGGVEDVTISHGGAGHFAGFSGACVRSQFYRVSAPPYDGGRESVSIGVALE